MVSKVIGVRGDTLTSVEEPELPKYQLTGTSWWSFGYGRIEIGGFILFPSGHGSPISGSSKIGSMMGGYGNG
jgi:hypothetical protein